MCCIVRNASFLYAYTFQWHLLCALFEERDWVFGKVCIYCVRYLKRETGCLAKIGGDVSSE